MLSFLSALVTFLLVMFALHLSQISAESCDVEGSLKLDNTTDTPYILLCSQGKWGYVCGREQNVSPWNKENVGVACQQLGLIRQSKYVAVPKLQTSLKSTGYTVHYRFTQCTGIEKRLIDCSHGELVSFNINPHVNCRHQSRYMYGTATCSNKSVECSNPGEIKLSVNNTVKICSLGEWYSLFVNVWTNAQAIVACKQLGLSTKGAKAVSSKTTDKKQLNMTFHCKGDENTLSDCSSSVVKGKDTSFVAAILCGEKTPPPTNITINNINEVVNITWDYDPVDATSPTTAVSFRVNCTTGPLTWTVNVPMNTTIVNGLVLTPGYTYKCCVLAYSTESGESETVCDDALIADQTLTDKKNITLMETSTKLSISRPTSSEQTSRETVEAQTVTDEKNITQMEKTKISTVSGPTATLSLASSTGSAVIIPWSVGILVGVAAGVGIVVLVWLSCVLICRRVKPSKKRYLLSSNNTTMSDLTSADNKLPPSREMNLVNHTYGSQPFQLSKPPSSVGITDQHATNMPYEPVYTDADVPGAVYSQVECSNIYYSTCTNDNGTTATEGEYSVLNNKIK